MTTIPPEIWIYVAHFIPEHDLRGMLEISRTFFQLAMNARYKVVYFWGFYDAAFKLAGMRRLRDPAIAPRVRSLDVNPSRLRPTHPLEVGSVDHNKHRLIYSASTEEAAQTMAEIVTCFSNLEEFSIDWTGNSSGERLHPFLITVWRTFRSSLRKLVLNAPMRDLEDLLHIAGSFTALQDLEVVFSHHARVDPGERNPTVSSLATFINAMSRTLRRLSISSQFGANVDISILFRSLENIPNLEQLEIMVNFDDCGLSDPLGITRILRNHAATLRHFEWNVAFEELLSTDEPCTELYVDWLVENIYDTSILSNLSTLQMAVPPSELDLAMAYIKRSADTLTSLNLCEGALTYEEVDMIISLFSHRAMTKHLGDLFLWVECLSPELILLLARKLPRLHSLKLFPSKIQGAAHSDTGRTEHAKAREFAAIMRTQNIRNWPLYDIHFFGSGYDMKLMGVLGECIPSIQWFSGRNKEELQKEIDEPL